MIALIVIAVIGIVAFFAWEGIRLAQRRKASARRRARWGKGAAKLKAWDLVFGRRAQKRLSFDATERAED